MKKNNIEILTFHQCVNYGAILQTYALQKYLNNNGAHAEILNYENSHFRDIYTWRRYFKRSSPFIMIYNYFTFPFWLVKKSRFNTFIKRNIVISNKINKCVYDEQVDKYVVGSDQVWNLKTTNEDYTYFLDFVSDNKKKYSYAASFGVDKLDSKYYDNVKKYISTFNSISVREKQAKNMIHDFLKENITVVLDPTLLLKKEEWEKIAQCKKKKEKFVLIYQLAYSKSLINFAKKLAKDNNCKIITIDGNPRQPIKAKYVLSAGPIEWLKLFVQADYIVTNSFHGLVFSLNLNKNFYFEYLGNGLTVNSRLQNIVSMFDIDDRNIANNLVSCKSDYPNYDRINSVLDEQRKLSYKWIDENLIKGNDKYGKK